MTKKHLQTLKNVTTWSGVLITLSGIVLNLARGGGWVSNGLTLAGLVITCCGHLVASALEKHRAAEREADERRFKELDCRLGQSEKEKEQIANAHEAQEKRTAALESENLSTKRKLDELRSMTYNAP